MKSLKIIMQWAFEFVAFEMNSQVKMTIIIIMMQTNNKYHFQRANGPSFMPAADNRIYVYVHKVHFILKDLAYYFLFTIKFARC